jgi:K+:H+ antiporter subunit KhtU
VGKIAAGHVAGRANGLTRGQGFNVGVALIAHGEFTIILAQLASGNDQIPGPVQAKLVAFAGLYVLITATLGVALMKESKAIGRRLFGTSRLAVEG